MCEVNSEVHGNHRFNAQLALFFLLFTCWYSIPSESGPSVPSKSQKVIQRDFQTQLKRTMPSREDVHSNRKKKKKKKKKKEREREIPPSKKKHGVSLRTCISFHSRLWDASEACPTIPRVPSLHAAAALPGKQKREKKKQKVGGAGKWKRAIFVLRLRLKSCSFVSNSGILGRQETLLTLMMLLRWIIINLWYYWMVTIPKKTYRVDRVNGGEEQATAGLI